MDLIVFGFEIKRSTADSRIRSTNAVTGDKRGLAITNPAIDSFGEERVKWNLRRHEIRRTAIEEEGGGGRARYVQWRNRNRLCFARVGVSGE